jgi:hypothetical protein
MKHFDDLTVTTDGDVVLMTGRLDQSALHGVLERVRLLRWRLLDVRRSRHSPREQGRPRSSHPGWGR